MSTVRLRLPAMHQGQAKIEQGLRRFNVLACGRRFGKDIYMMTKLIQPALEGYPVAWGAPTYKMLTENWRAVNAIVSPVVAERDKQERRLVLLTGGIIDFWSLDNPDMMRGRKYKRFVANEAGFVPDLMDTWNFVARATLADLKGDAFIGGTPKGMNGFWQMYMRGMDEGQPAWACWQMSSYENPYVPKSEIDDMVATMPERTGQQEIFAQFLDDAGGVFRRVNQAATAETLDAAQPDRQYVIGVDWGQQEDFTVCTVLDVGNHAVVCVDRYKDIDYTVQSNRLKALCGRFHPDAVIAELNSIGQPIIERLRREGMPIQPFTTTNASKTEAIDALALAFEQSAITIPNNPVLIGELQAYQMERLPSGLRRFGAPEGMHDDCVMSLALAWTALSRRVTVVDDPFIGW